jgi:AAA15 family ATPase/GTPase
VLNLGYEFRMTNRSLTPEEALDVVDRELVAYFQNRGNEEAEMLDDPADVLSEKFAAILQKAASNNDSGHLRLVDARTGTALAAKDVGMGISQVIPILVAASALERKIICMEQPELHLHPGLQTKLADALIASAMGQRNTLLIETHSEHLILRILRRIRETTEGDMQDWPDDLRRACPNGIRPEDVAVLYVEPGTEGAKVQCLRINELGEFIDEWPKGFFEERIREVL